MDITIANRLYVYDYTQEAYAWCRENLVLQNPDYYKKEKMGKWTGNTPKEIALFEKFGKTCLWLPFGCIHRFMKSFPNTPYKADFGPLRPFCYKSSIIPYEYQEKAIQAALRRKNGVLVAPCGSGKGLPLDAKIYTPTGWKRNGDLQIGDNVIGSDGNTITVTGIYDKGEVPAYKITFSDNTFIVCDQDHLWSVQKQTQRKCNPNKWWVESTKEIYEKYKNIKRQDFLYIPIVKPVNFEQKEVPIDPWLLGFLIGDGCFMKHEISFSTNETDLLNRVKEITYKKWGRKETICYTDKYDYRFKGANMLYVIRSLGLDEKRSYEKSIPDIYKYNSIDVRLSTLQGLFDADGYCGRGGVYEYSTSSKQLANDVTEMIQSLGGAVKVKEKMPTYTHNGEKRVGRKSYRLFFKLYEFDPFTSDKHKKNKHYRAQYTSAYRIIKNIEPCGNIVSRCITVDAEDQLYVTDGFVVTHNTQIGLEIVSRIGGRTLWLTHTQDLLNQSMTRAKSVLGNVGQGTITEGKVNCGEGITFATVQTLSKIDLAEYQDYWDVVICDECHHAAGSPTKVTQFYKVLSKLKARYKIGLTATPKRADGLEESMFALLGDIIYEVKKEDVAYTTCPVKVWAVQTGYTPDYDMVLLGDGTINYMELINQLVTDENRFRFVSDYINGLTGTMIVFGNRVDYLKKLSEEFKGRSVCLSGMGQSKAAKKERKDALEKLSAGELDAVFATYQLGREGLDCPSLQYVVFATPEKDESTVQQASGRVARKAEGKEYGTVIDFVDNFGMYKGWAKKRATVYKKLDYEY